MRAFAITTAGLALLLGASAASAADYQQYTTTNKDSNATGENGQKLICRQVAHEGQLINKPVCLTPAQWERARLESQRQVQDIQQRALTGTINP